MIAALIALIALLMLGGTDGTGWTEDLEKSIKQVEDKDRRENILDAIGNHEDGINEVADSVEKHFVELLDTHIDFQSSEQDFDAAAQKLKDDQERAFLHDLKMREIMKANLTAEEWSSVFSTDDN